MEIKFLYSILYLSSLKVEIYSNISAYKEEVFHNKLQDTTSAS